MPGPRGQSRPSILSNRFSKFVKECDRIRKKDVCAGFVRAGGDVPFWAGRKEGFTDMAARKRRQPEPICFLNRVV